MVPKFISPGVIVTERDFSDYLAAQQSTTCGLVSTAQRGPLNVPTLCTTPEQFLEIFGEPSVNQYGPHAALNFLRRGNQLLFNRVAKIYEEGVAVFTGLGSPATNGKVYVINVEAGHPFSVGDFARIVQPGFATSQNLEVLSTTSTSVTFATPLLDSYDEDLNNVRIDIADAGSAAAFAEVFGISRKNSQLSRVIKFTARHPGSFANYDAKQGIEVVIEDGGQYANIDPVTNLPYESDNGIPLQGVLPSAPSVDSKLELISLTTADGVKVGQTRGVNKDSVTSKTLTVGSRSSELKLELLSTNGFEVGDTVEVSGTTTYDGEFEVLSISGDYIVLDGFGGTITPGALTTGVVEKTSGENQFGVVYRCTAVTTTHSTWTPQGLLTKRARILYQGRQVEVFDNLTAYDPTSSTFWDTVIGTVDNPVSRYVTCEYLGSGEQPINTYNSVKHPNNPRLIMGIGTQVKIADTTNSSTETFQNGKGYNGDNPSSEDYIGAIDEDGNYSGLQHFRRVELYDISILACPGISLPAVIEEMVSVLEERNDCLGIIDPPIGLSVQQVVDWHNGSGSYTGYHDAIVTNKAALYYPWVKQYDPYTKRELWLPPSCIVPGIMAYNDFVSEVWNAPAGIIRGRVPNSLAVEKVVSKGDMDYMYGPGNGNAINSIVKFAKNGIVVYGQRTLQRHPSALDRVNVRRLLFYIEKIVAATTRRLVFEQNDPILWAQFINLIDPVLRALQAQRALEFYKVVCDETTNTPEVRNSNTMVAKIFLIPTKSAEHINLQFTLLASGANVQEFIDQDINGSVVQA